MEDEAWPSVDVYDVSIDLPGATAIYETLPEGSIRLLELSSDLSCRLTSHPLADCPPYVALSYTWGRPPDQHFVVVNGERKAVRKNLWQFLKEAKEMSFGYLWIDALYIDQADLEERLQQVQLMPEIYKGARSVLIWSGPNYGGSDAAMDYLASHRRPRWNGRDGTDILVAALCRRAYWTRLWIFQELVLAQRILLMCGSRLAPWERFYSMVLDPLIPRMINSAQRQLTFQSPAASILQQVGQGPSKLALFELIVATQDLQCAEVRDKVYALLGAASAGHHVIAPDYGMPIVALMNAVLRTHHALHPPRDLESIEEQCQQLDRVFAREGDQYSVFRLEGGNGWLPSDENLADHPLAHDQSSVSLWWAAYHGHECIADILMMGRAFHVRETLQKALSHDMFLPAAAILLENGAAILAWGNDAESRMGLWLFNAIKYGHVGIVALITEHGLGINAKISVGHHNESGTTEDFYNDSHNDNDNALHLASKLGRDDMVKLLLAGGADVNASGGYFGSALHAASSRGHRDIVEQLLTSGADVNTVGGQSGNALQAASLGGNWQYHYSDNERGPGVYGQIVNLLLDAGAAVNAEGGHFGSALQAASTGGRVEIVKVLLANGADVNAEGGEFGSALEAASCQRHTEVVQLLLVNGAVDRTNGRMYANALCAASWEGRADIVKLLLSVSRKAEEEGNSDLNKAALRYAIEGVHADALTLLIQAPTRISPESGMPGIHQALKDASEMGHYEVVKLRLASGVKLASSTGMNPLALASKGGHDEVVRLLLAAGANSTLGAAADWEALHLAIKTGKLNTVTLLLEAGADVNAWIRYPCQEASLHTAARYDRVQIMRLLLDAGANDHAMSSDWRDPRTALDLAKAAGHHEIVAMLSAEADNCQTALAAPHDPD